MHRQCGRYLTFAYFFPVELLPDDTLFSPSQIAKRRFHPKDPNFKRMKESLYRFGLRNGLGQDPDNGLKDPNGKTVLVRGKARLQPGEKRCRWYGLTWKSKLYNEDRARHLKYIRTELILTLWIGHEQKLAAAEKKQPALTRRLPTRPPNFFGFLGRRRIKALLAAAVLLGMLAFLQVSLRYSSAPKTDAALNRIGPSGGSPAPAAPSGAVDAGAFVVRKRLDRLMETRRRRFSRREHPAVHLFRDGWAGVAQHRDRGHHFDRLPGELRSILYLNSHNLSITLSNAAL